MKPIYKRLLALALCLSLTLGCVGLVSAENREAPDEPPTSTAASAPAEDTARQPLCESEAVYVLTDATGAMEKQIVSRRSRDASGAEETQRTETRQELPVELRFSYRLNGKEITPEELAGKSGSVEIRIDYTNKVSEAREIRGREERLYTPFLMLSALVLDNERYSEVEMENGKLVSDGSRTLAIGYALPGMRESLALPEELGLELPDHVCLRAEVKDFSLDSVYTLAASDLFGSYDENDPEALEKLLASVQDLSDGMAQLLEGAKALNAGLDTLMEKSGDLQSGVSALAEGADQLSEGAKRLSGGAKDLASGTAELKNGAGQLAQGAESLRDGSKELAGGADQLSTGLNQLSQSSAALNGGAETVFGSLLSAAETQLKANGLSVGSLSVSNYQTELNRIIKTLDPDAVYAAALAQVSAGVEAKRPEIQALVSQAVREQVSQAVTAAVEEQIRAAVLAQLPESAPEELVEQQVAAQMSSETVQAMIAQQIEAQMQSEEIVQSIADNTEAQVQKAIADTMAGPEVQAKLQAAGEGAQSVIALKTSLDQYNAFYLGVKRYTAGVDAAARGAKELSAGAKKLQSGAAELSDGTAALSAGTGKLSAGARTLSGGAAELSEGAARLDSGVHALQDGLPALVEGVEKLLNGSAQLREGLETFDEKGIQTIVRLVKEDGQDLAERLETLAELSRAYRASYTGCSEDAEGELRFIYRSASIG